MFLISKTKKLVLVLTTFLLMIVASIKDDFIVVSNPKALNRDTNIFIPYKYVLYIY